jgi:hypothetical protein
VHLHLDPVGGVAGDMFLAAVLDAWPELASDLVAAMRAGGLPEAASVEVLSHRDHAVTGSRVVVSMPEPAEHHAHHPHTPFRTIRERLEASSLAPAVRRRAVAIFTLLAEAEGAVHGVDPEDVELHEVGAWDSIADVVGAAFAIEALGAASWSVGPLPLGSGRVASAHGSLPVPAPATVRLLEGFAVYDDGIGGERVTPTGAAIVRHLAPAAGLPRVPRRLERGGTGFGTRSLGELSNVLRLLAFAEPESSPGDAWQPGEVAEIAFEVDDQTAEDLAVGLDRLREVAGVLDVGQVAVLGKRGRLAAQVRVLAAPEHLDAAIDACFAETATLGLRWHLVRRATLDRRSELWRDGTREVRVRRARRPTGAPTAKAEMADLAGEPGGRAVRERLRRAAEADVLAREDVPGREGSDGSHDR